MKPAIVHIYNSLKGGVDTLDKATGSYSCKRRTNRYSMSAVFNLIDLCCHNAFHTFRAAHADFLENNRSSKYRFLDWLSKELALEHVKQRRIDSHTPPETKVHIDAFLRNFEEMYGSTDNPIAKCSTCNEKNALKKCEACKKVTCAKHHYRVNVYQCPNCRDEEVNLQDFKKSPIISKRCAFCSRQSDNKTKVHCTY